jgi:two-component system phosphate regulon sensor histidine kinase PhoR
MTTQRKKILLATLAVVTFFAVYETVKTLLFPRMSVVTSHVVTTVVVGIITVFFAWYVVLLQSSLLRSREESNQRLRETLTKSERDENLLRSIVVSVAEGLVITDHDSNVLLVNDAARALLNLGARPVARLTDISRDPQLHRAFSTVLATDQRAEARIETRSLEDRATDKRILQLHAAPLRLDEDDEIDGVVGVFIDITKLERLERVRQEFLSNVSHELRTPLAAITAYTETLLDGGINDGDNSLRFLHTIERNTERMRALVNDISELSAIESGAVKLNIDRFPLPLLVGEVFTGLQPRASKYGVRLESKIPEEFVLTADRRRLEQILVNLVDNAIKFNRPGGTVTVLAELAPDSPHDILRVRDTGTGIPAEHLSRVFERFYRVDKARSREAGGTGLGLAIVKHLALAHGGEAYVASEAGAGSEFSIKLPRRAAAPTPTEEHEPASYAAKP